jgi:hypothetical protein
MTKGNKEKENKTEKETCFILLILGSHGGYFSS